MTAVVAQLVLVFAALIVAGIVLAYAWACGVFAVAPRRAKQLAALRAIEGPRPWQAIPPPRPVSGRPAPGLPACPDYPRRDRTAAPRRDPSRRLRPPVEPGQVPKPAPGERDGK